MAHPLQDKLFVFIGTPKRCTRQAARDALIAAGGITDNGITAFTDYVVAFDHDGKTKIYKKALNCSQKGILVLLTEEQLFDILEGRTAPPEKPECDRSIIVTPTKVPEAEDVESDRRMNEILNRKRMANLAKYGVPTPDGGRMKVDLRLLDMARRVAERMKGPSDQNVWSEGPASVRCDFCGKPAKVHFSNAENGEGVEYCQDCYNKMMAEYTETDLPDTIPERLSFTDDSGATRTFEIEFMIFANCKTLKATEVGKLKLMTDVFGELDEDFTTMWDTLISRIKRILSEKYMDPNGYVIGSKAVGYVKHNPDRDALEIIIDGKPYTWAELERSVSAFEGFKIKIEFGDIGETLDDEETDPYDE